MVVPAEVKDYLKKTQFYAPVPSLSFGKALYYLLDDVPSFENTFRRIILPLVQIGRREMANGKIRVPILGKCVSDES